MCGIVGIFNLNSNSKIEIEGYLDLIKYRGPDDRGVFYEDGISLGHQRLSILDLSSNGHQPMISSCGRYVIVFNGEVYNYKAIGKKLSQDFNFQFKTDTDTEVILESYIHYGESFVDQLNGMFSFAIFDRKEKSIRIYRDRIGIKPLFYSNIGDELVFSSELKVIKKHLNGKLKLNRNTIDYFLHLGFIPAPLTIYEDVYKLEAGSFLYRNDKEFSQKRYWNLKDKVSEPIVDEAEALEKMDWILEDSTKLQLNSDVPLGVFLSGGIDSSIVASYASRMSSETINTFSLGIDDKKTDESVYAKEIARFIGTNHHELRVSQNEAIDVVEGLISAFDEPFADSSMIPTYLVSKLAKEKVTVALSGDGGDELFFGYGSYNWANRLSNPIPNLFKNEIGSFLKYFPSRYKRHSRYFLGYQNGLKGITHIHSSEQNCFSLKEIDQIKHGKNVAKFKEFNSFESFLKEMPKKMTAKEKQSLFDLYYYLPDDLLTKVDRMSMLNSLEVRPTLLDHRLVELAYRIDPKLKNKGNELKYLLKRLLYKQIPSSYFDRPKEGFSIPLNKWLKNELYFLINDYLSDKVILKYEIVDINVVNRLIESYMKGNSHLYQQIWQLIILHKFLEENN